MTLGDADVAAVDPRAQAFGYAQRRAWVFFAWWYGAIIAIAGAVHAALTALAGQYPETGTGMFLLGAGLSALGWLVTLGVRFSHKIPKSASDIPRVEQSIRTNPLVVKLSVIGAILIAAGLVLLTPNGRSPELLPITGLIAAALLSVAGGMAYSGWLMKNSGELYARWLERRRQVLSLIERSGKPAKRPTLKWYWNVLGLLLMGVGVFGLLLPVWDSIGIEAVRCEVVSAEPRTNSGGSRGSASTAGVLVQTTNCGSIHVSPGVTFDNRDEIAASFTPGSEFEFDMGWYSRVITRDIRQGIPSVQGYRLVD